MSQKSKKKKSRAEPGNKVRVKLRLQKHQAYSSETSLTLKDLGLDEKRYKKHIELLEAENIIKREGISGQDRYWIRSDKIGKKKKGRSSSLIFLWVGSVVLILFFIAFL